MSDIALQSYSESDLVVAVAANPHDLRPAVAAIMKAQNWLLERLPADRKIVIVIGESHDNQMDPLLQRALLAAHMRQRDQNPQLGFAFGYEMNKNFRSSNTHEGLFSGFYRTVQNILYPHDPHGVQTAKIFGLQESCDHAYDAKRDLLNYCVSNSISLRFNDIAQDETGIIDNNDPQAKRLIESLHPSSTKSTIMRAPLLGHLSAISIELSNHAIVENALEHMRDTNSRLYIQECGSLHVFGRNDEEYYPYDDSLTALFTRQEVSVLSVVTNYRDDQKFLPSPAMDAYARSVRITMPKEKEGRLPFKSLKRHVTEASGLTL